MRNIFAFALSLLMMVLLSGCIFEDKVDLKKWMEEETNKMQPSVDEMPTYTPYEAEDYEDGIDGMVDPFRLSKIIPEVTGRKGENQPDYEARVARNNPLEAIPLEAFKMIGYMEVEGMPVGVVQADKLIKQVKINDYIGKDFGLIIGINDHEIKLREKVKDAEGYIDRENTLMLQGQEEKK